MYELFASPPRRFTGAHSFPEMPYLRRSFRGLIDDVKTYYRRFPKRVDGDNVLGNLLVHIPRRWDMDDHRYLRFVEDTARGLVRAFNFTSAIHKGKVHEAGITLGKDTDEIVISTYAPFSIQNAERKWREWSPYTYLYHSRTDLGLPVLNNHSPGRGYGVAVVNIPMLALQYRHWLRTQADSEQRDTVYRFIGSVVLPNTLESYLDIAFFNRLARQSRGIGTKRFPTPHPFYLTDFSSRVDALCKKILETQERRSEDIEQVVNTTPVLVQETLWDAVQLPHDPVTRHNEWALQIARLPYIRYIVETAVHPNRGDRTFLNELYSSLVEASYDRIFAGVGSPSVVKHYREHIRHLIATMEAKGHGW